MENMHKSTDKAVEIVDAVPVGSTPVGAVSNRLSPRQEVENTLNYLNATYNLLQHGLFVGQDSNIHIQVKAWIENQQKGLSLQLAKLVASESEKPEQKNG